MSNQVQYTQSQSAPPNKKSSCKILHDEKGKPHTRLRETGLDDVGEIGEICSQSIHYLQPLYLDKDMSIYLSFEIDLSVPL